MSTIDVGNFGVKEIMNACFIDVVLGKFVETRKWRAYCPEFIPIRVLPLECELAWATTMREFSAVQCPSRLLDEMDLHGLVHERGIPIGDGDKTGEIKRVVANFWRAFVNWDKLRVVRVFETWHVKGTWLDGRSRWHESS